MRITTIFKRVLAISVLVLLLGSLTAAQDAVEVRVSNQSDWVIVSYSIDGAEKCSVLMPGEQCIFTTSNGSHQVTVEREDGSDYEETVDFTQSPLCVVLSDEGVSHDRCR